MKNYIFCLIVLPFLVFACSTLKVTADFDKNMDFTGYQTYSYLGWNEKSSALLNDFDKKRIETAFNNEFKSRGMDFVETGGDIEVSLYLVTDSKTATTAYTDYYGGYGGYFYGHPWGWGRGFATTTYHQYDYIVGTLVCDVFDSNGKKLVWQGVGSGTVNDDPEVRQKNIPTAVNKIMALFPVTPVQ